MSTKEQPTMGTCCKTQKNVATKSKSNIAVANNATLKTHSGPKTRITLKFDVGFSNALYLRGQGANLSWEKGILLKNVNADEWIWETNVPFTFCEFKVLVNDDTYEIGQNHTLTCGASICYTPQF
jgi:hypothetical protein